MFHSVIQDVRFALRMFRAGKGLATVAVLSLALGIGANTAIFSLIDAVMLKYLPVSHPEELLQIAIDERSATFTNPMWEQLRDHQDVFAGVFALSEPRFNLSHGGEVRYARGAWAGGDFFSTLGVHAVLGRTLTPSDDRRGCAGRAVLSYSFWQAEYGGNASVLGKTISLDGHPFEIVGVSQPGFTGLDVGRGLDIVAPLCSEAIVRSANSQLDRRSSWWLSLIGRPKPGLRAAQVTARLKTLAPGIFAATVPQNYRPEDQQTYRQQSLASRPAANGLSSIRRQYRPALIALMVVVAVVLLIACANVANLLLARAASRQREIAIRLALGLGRVRLIRQLLTESLVLAVAGAAMGVLFAQWGSRLLVGFLSSSGNQVFLDLSVNGHVLAFTAAVAIATGLLFGMAPAWRGTRVEPQAAMKAGARGILERRSRFSLGKFLVAAQVALSLVLLVGAGLLLSTFGKLAALDPGFQPGHVLLVNIDARNANYPQERRVETYRAMLDTIRAIPGVRSASASNNTPISGNTWNDEIQVEGFTPKSRDDSIVYMNQVSPRFFETLATPVLAGRDFDGRDTLGSTKVAIVNQTMVKKFFHNANPLGKTFRSFYPKLGPPIEVIGIVGDAKYRSLREETLPTAYLPTSQDENPGNYTTFEVRAAGQAADLIPGVKAAMEQINRDLALNFQMLSTQVAESLNRERLLATLSGFFGLMALLLAVIGLYGVMSYNMARRRAEIGIRMALGAAQRKVIRMVLGEVSLLVGVGLVIGLGAALLATRLIESFLFGLTGTDPVTMAIAAGVLAMVALIAGYVPAHRASQLDPMAALREE